MIDDRDVFERSVQRFAPPVDAFERMMTRRVRKQRNKRLAAGVLVLILAFVVIGAVLRSIATSPSIPTTPNPSPTASNGNVSFVGTDLVDFSDGHSDFGIVFGVDPTDGKTRTILDTNCPSHPALEAACGHLDFASLDWSPDGSRIAFTLFADQAYREFEGIWVMEMETEEIRQLTSCTDPCAKQDDLDWSPDGSRIAYSQADVEYCTSGSYGIGSCSLYTMNADGSDREKLPTGPVLDPVDPSWSPDGGSIAFSGRIGEDWFVYTMALDGSERVPLATDLPSPQQTQPAWSPDGSRIAFVTWEGAAPGAKPTGLDLESGLPFAVWSMATDGSDRQLLYESCCMIGGAGYGVQGPVWSPDGTSILVFQGTGGGLQVIDARTGEVFEIPAKDPMGAVAWRPVA